MFFRDQWQLRKLGAKPGRDQSIRRLVNFRQSTDVATAHQPALVDDPKARERLKPEDTAFPYRAPRAE